MRYYEEQGLLESHRLDSGHRRYGADAADVVRRIRSLLDAGLPTRVIRGLLPCVRRDGTVAECKVETPQEHLRDLDGRISALSETRTSLAGLIAATRALGREPCETDVGTAPVRPAPRLTRGAIFLLAILGPLGYN